jgi:hypothetical protein
MELNYVELYNNHQLHVDKTLCGATVGQHLWRIGTPLSGVEQVA